MTRTMADLAKTLDVIAGVDPADLRDRGSSRQNSEQAMRLS